VKKNGESFFGYKDHIKTDSGTNMITDYRVTSANVHDSVPFGELVGEADRVNGVSQKFLTYRGLVSAPPRKHLSASKRKLQTILHVYGELVFMCVSMGIAVAVPDPTKTLRDAHADLCQELTEGFCIHFFGQHPVESAFEGADGSVDPSELTFVAVVDEGVNGGGAQLRRIRTMQPKRASS